MRRVVLVGLGLIGGSIALALRRHIPQLEIIGVDTDAVVNSSRCRELLSRGIAKETLGECSPIAFDANLVVLAVPVCEIAKQVCSWLEARVPVTDCGSTKSTIVKAADSSPGRTWFLPGHPMAGRERGGLQSADPDLFKGRSWIVCPEGVRREPLEVTRELVNQLGALWTEMTPWEHDRAVALTSHLPQILASWLAASAGESAMQAAGPAFADMTRIAGGSEAIWRDIFLTNSTALAKVLGGIASDLATIAQSLARTEPELNGVLELLANARQRASKPVER